MGDRGYQENARWEAYAQPLAVHEADKNKVSVDEAMENLRRADMARVKPNANAPGYWMKLH